MREPLLHFLLIGLALFVVYSWMHRGRGGVEPSHEIALSFDDLRTMDLYFESQWHRQPTAVEFNAMVENKIQEEILYREGLAMGLDKDDTIVKRRMAQKLQFLAEDVASAHEPTTEELQAWFAKNSEKFALPEPRHLPAPVLLIRQARSERSRRCRRGAREAVGPAGERTHCRHAGRSVHVQGLLRGPNAPGTREGVRPHLRAWASSSCNQARGRARSNPASAGTSFSSTPSSPDASRPLRRSSRT